MKVKYYNAKTNQVAYRDMTLEEIEAMSNHQTDIPEPEPTPESQIAELKAQLAALETILLGGDTNAE